MAQEAPTTIKSNRNRDDGLELNPFVYCKPTSLGDFDRLWQFRALKPLPNTTTLDFDPSTYDPTTCKPTSLGDLDRLWQFCGLPHAKGRRSRHGSTESSNSAASSGSTVPSSAPPIEGDDEFTIRRGSKTSQDKATESEDFNDLVNKTKNVRWKDEMPRVGISETRRRSAQVSVGGIDTNELDHLLRLKELEGLLEGKSSSRACQSIDVSSNRYMTLRSGKRVSLVPPNAPPFPAIPTSYLDTRQIQPILTLTITEKKALLVKIMQKKKLLAHDYAARMDMTRWGGNVAPDGIHVFVDLSNINIGFFNELKRVRKVGQGNNPKMPPLAFHSLAFLLERNRPVARRVLAGSHGGLLYGQHARRPDHMYDAEKYGYEMNILEPVFKMKSRTPVRKKLHGTGHGYATTSGQSSGSDAPVVGTQTRQEQCG